MKTSPPPSLFNLKQQPVQRANALIGAALRSPLRGRFLSVVRLLWWGLLAVTIVLFVLTIPARYSQLVVLGAQNSIALGELGLSQFAIAALLGTIDGISFLVYNFVAVLIFLRKSHEWIGLLASVALITTVFAVVRPTDALLFVQEPLRVPLLIMLAIAAGTVTVFIYIFPDGHFTPRWTLFVALGLVLFAVFGLVERIWLTQPFRWPPAPLSPVIYLGVLGGAIVQIYRYRRVSDAVQKQQMKWVVGGAVAGAIGLFGFIVIVPAVAPRVLLPGMPRVLYILIGAPLFYIALLQLPIALAVSILRYHLWNIDLLISRTLILVFLTGILAGLFAAIEALTQDLFVILTGQESKIATIISTLIVVAAFTPLKELIQKFVEHRFQDIGDPTHKLDAFAQLVERRVSPLHPAQITRRLLNEAVATFNAKGGAAYLLNGQESQLIHQLGNWDGEAAFCFPLTAGENNTRFGWVALDDRKNGLPYTERERKALEDVAQKVARALEEDAGLTE